MASVVRHAKPVHVGGTVGNPGTTIYSVPAGRAFRGVLVLSNGNGGPVTFTATAAGAAIAENAVLGAGEQWEQRDIVLTGGQTLFVQTGGGGFHYNVFGEEVAG